MVIQQQYNMNKIISYYNFYKDIYAFADFFL